SILWASLLVSSISCGKIENPEFRKLSGFGIKKLGITQTTVGFEIVYYNPNNFGVTVKEALINVYVDSTFLGEFRQPQTTIVGSRAEFAIPLEGAITLGRALDLNLPELVGKEVGVRAEGNVKVGKGGVFISKEIKYAGRHILDEKLIKNPAAAGLMN
ncbi:MAG: LEA type 2 family protein, partial [Chitinophagaceae bacterium]